METKKSEFHTNFTSKRYLVYGLITCIVMILPFIRIGGHHFFLLSFDHKRLDLFFIGFSTQELYLMPFLLILLFIGVFFITTLGGRIWCAWSCPQTIFRVIYRDFIQTKLLKIRASAANKQKDFKGHFFKKILAVLLFYCIALVAVSNLLWYFVPPEDFFTYLANPSEHLLLVGIVLIASTLFTFDIVALKENFCVYVCPYARIQSVMFDTSTVQVLYDEQRGGKIFDGAMKLHKKPPQGECIGCEACVMVCPTHIDIRRGMQLECINCLECADACSHIQAKFNRPSLINWTSSLAMQTRSKVRYLRFRTIAYFIVMLIALAAFFVMGSKKEHMLLNINRSSELYNIERSAEGARVQNAYVFLFQNTDDREHTYYFEAQIEGVNDKEVFKIVRPSKEFKLRAGEKRKQIVILEANKDLNTLGVRLNENTDTILPLKITAYAIDERERIEIFRDSIFVYPKQEAFESK